MQHKSAKEILTEIKAAHQFDENDVSTALDDVVHDLKAEEAANIDNDGIEAQIDYIMDCLGQEETIKLLKEIVSGY